MDARGRAIDNIYIERFWRSLKYEKIYLNPANGGLELYENVNQYIRFYNQERRHTEIGKMPPDEMCFQNKNCLLTIVDRMTSYTDFNIQKTARGSKGYCFQH